MRIGVISDTHIVGGGFGLRKAAVGLLSKQTTSVAELKKMVEPHFKGVDRILHAGDLVDSEVVEMLEEIAPVDAVCGNMDDGDVTRNLPIRKVIDVEGRRIGLIHGWGPPGGIIERIRREFTEVHAIVFGHTHAAMNEIIGDVFYFNPGSPTDKRFAAYNSLGVLNVTKDTINGEIIRL